MSSSQVSMTGRAVVGAKQKICDEVMGYSLHA
jgi:hypothetical protein